MNDWKEWGILTSMLIAAVMWVQVPQWADDWAICAVDIPDAKCHWYVMSPDNTFGEGFDWEDAPWFDANGLNDIAPVQKQTVVQKLQENEFHYRNYVFCKFCILSFSDSNNHCSYYRTDIKINR